MASLRLRVAGYRRPLVAMTEPTAARAAQVRQLFDAKAATWSAKYEEGGRLAGRLAQLATAAQEQATPGCSVLDLGCGTGDLARHLATAGFQVTGCDISAEMLGRAEQSDPAMSVEWVMLDPHWISLPFRPASFHVIIASSVLEYVDDPVAVLRECFQLLKSGGTLHCTIPDLRHPVRWLEWAAALAARLPAIVRLSHCLPRLDRYLSYLRISRQRHSSQWWNIAAMHACTPVIRQPCAASGRLPLRLISFQKPEEMTDGS